MKAHDVLVVGAGPAGSTLAAFLARRGRSVLLVDRERFPRPTLCGEFVSPEALEPLAEPGVEDALRQAGAVTLSRLRVAVPGALPLVHALPREGLGVTRLRLDALLLERARAAGAEVRTGCLARGPRAANGDGVPDPDAAEDVASRGAGGVFEVTTICAGKVTRERARVVVDAAGRAGLRRPSNGRPRQARGTGAPARDAKLVALQRHYRAEFPTERERARGADRADMVELYPFEGGYCGFNAVEEGVVNLCFLAPAARLRAARSPDALLRALARERPALAERLAPLRAVESRFRSAVLPSGSGSGATNPRGGAKGDPHAPLLIRVGDAHGAIAPLCGDGVAMAIHGALLAVPWIEGWLDGAIDAGSSRVGYEKAWRKTFGKSVRAGAHLHRALVRPEWALALVLAGTAFPPLTSWLFRRTRCARRSP